MTTGFNVKLVTATALLCWAVLAGVSRGDSVRWISQALPPDTVLPDSPVLRVRNAAGTLVAETDRCRIFTGDDTAWIAGRVELPGTERYSVSLRRSQTADEADGDLLLVPALSGSRTRFDVVLLLDASHSMRRNDPRELRKSATRAFCRLSALSPRIRRLSLVRFRRDARILVPPTAPSAVRGLDNTLDDLRPYSSTDFDPPFETAFELLKDAPGGRAVLFLSDGEPRKDYEQTHRRLKQLDCPVYSIGLSADADAERLGRIADETGGQYFEAPSATELETIFNRVFRILSTPRTVAEFGQVAETLRFALDTTMQNPFLTVAFRNRRASNVLLDGEPLQKTARGDVLDQRLDSSAPGWHTLRLQAGTRASCVLGAETSCTLETFAVNRLAARNTPITAGCYVRERRRLADIRLSCELRNPDGKRRNLSMQSTEFGLFSTRLPTRQAGTYKVVFELHARLEGKPVFRRREVVFTRSAEGVPAASRHHSSPRVDLRPVPKETDSHGLTPRLVRGPADQAAPEPTCWSNPETVELSTMPGRTASSPLEVRLRSPSNQPVRVDVTGVETDAVTLTVDGGVRANTPSTVVVTARADERAAGMTVEGATAFRHGDQTWAVPVRVRVDTPAISARFKAGLARQRGADLTASGVLTVSVDADARCEVRIQTTEGLWTPESAQCTVGSSSVRVPMRFRVAPPSASTEWNGEFVVSGPGLRPVRVPWGLTWTYPATKSGAGTVSAADADWRVPWRWILALVAAVLLCLLVMTIRGSRRAAFLLVSALAHLAVLFFVLPESTLRDIADSAGMKPQAVAVGKAVVEERVAPEAETTTDSQAEASEWNDKKRAVPSDEDSPDDAPTPEVATPKTVEKPRETAAATPLHEAPERKELRTENVDPERTPPPQKRREQTTSRQAQAKTATSLPQPVALSLEDISRQSQTRTPTAALPPRKGKLNTLSTAVPKVSKQTGDLHSETATPAKRKPAPDPVRKVGAQPTQRRMTGPAPSESALAGDAPEQSRRARLPSPTVSANGAGRPRAESSVPSLAFRPIGQPAELANGVKPKQAEASPSDTRSAASRDMPRSGPAGPSPTNLTRPPVRHRREQGVADRARALTPQTSPRRTSRFAAVSPLASRTAPSRLEIARPSAPSTADLPSAPAEQISKKPRDGERNPDPSNLPAPGKHHSSRPPSTVADQSLDEPPHHLDTPKPAPPITAGQLAGEPAIGRTTSTKRRSQSRWHRTFPNFKHSGDWDCDRTAMLNLAHEVERRTGSVLPFESRDVSVTDPDLHKAPFLFLSGHRDFRFSDDEVDFLRSYLDEGGALWINDSTDVDNETFDRAVRRELKRVLPNQAFRAVPHDHAIFRTPYDLSSGLAGFRVPPGDKYRQDYHEGIWREDRLVVVYTRNDYGDGLEIDARTHPAMPSLTDLTRAEMQESSVRMGTNIALHFVGGSSKDEATLRAAATRRVDNPARQREQQWKTVPTKNLGLCNDPNQWAKPEGWTGPHYLRIETGPGQHDGFVQVRFREGDSPFDGWRSQATLARPVSATLTNAHVVLLDVYNPANGGARLAAAFTGPETPYIESEPVFLRPGMNRAIAIDLRKATFKTKAVQWQERAAFPDTMTLDRLFILTYPQQGEGALEFGNIRLAKP